MTAASQASGQSLMSLFIQELIRRMETAPQDQKAADLEVVRKFLSDQSITLASVQRGDFGETARQVAEEFPFPEEETPAALQ